MTIISPLPYTLANGTTNDATQVMADFSQIVSNVNANAAHSGANSDITSLSGLTIPLSVAQGGTGNVLGTANVAGGAAGGIVYQSGANTSAVSAAGIAGQVLTSSGAGAPIWSANAPYYKNYAHNGQAQVAQRLSTAFGTVNAPIYGQVDRWIVGTAGATTQTAGTLDQGTMTCLDGVIRNCVQATGFTTTGASSAVVMKQRLESRDVVDLNGQTITVQCEVFQATGAAINYTIAVNSANALDNFSAVSNIATSTNQAVTSGTVTQISFTTTLNASQAANGLEFVVSAACGAITSQTFKMSRFKVAATNAVTPYNDAGRTYEEGLAVCQRYFTAIGSTYPATGVPIASGFTRNGASRYGSYFLPFLVPMRTYPATYDVIGGIAQLSADDGTGGSWPLSAAVFAALGPTGLLLNTTAGSGTFTTGYASILFVEPTVGTPSVFVTASAEL